MSMCVCIFLKIFLFSFPFVSTEQENSINSQRRNTKTNPNRENSTAIEKKRKNSTNFINNKLTYLHIFTLHHIPSGGGKECKENLLKIFQTKKVVHKVP